MSDQGHELFKQLQRILPVLHEWGVVDADALLAVFVELTTHKPLTLDHLTRIFGVDRIYALISTPRQDADRAHLRRELLEIEDLFTTGESHLILSAQLRLMRVLQEELIQRPRWWAASQAAST